MTDANIARLESARDILGLIEREEAKRRAYLRAARRAAILAKLLPLAAAYGAGFLSAQLVYVLTF